jgi:methionine-rich copper-binding protein CopC
MVVNTSALATKKIFGGIKMSRKIIAILCSLTLLFSMFTIIGVSAKADKAAPSVKVVTPRNNATGVSITANITIKFSENIYAAKNFKKINLKKQSKSTSTKVTILGNTLVIDHTYALGYSTNYVLAIPSNSIKDGAGNILKKAIVVKFKTKGKPAVTPTPTIRPTKTPKPTVTPAPTATPSPTATPVPTATPEPTGTPAPTIV